MQFLREEFPCACYRFSQGHRKSCISCSCECICKRGTFNFPRRSRAHDPQDSSFFFFFSKVSGFSMTNAIAASYFIFLTYRSLRDIRLCYVVSVVEFFKINFSLCVPIGQRISRSSAMVQNSRGYPNHVCRSFSRYRVIARRKEADMNI